MKPNNLYKFLAICIAFSLVLGACAKPTNSTTESISDEATTDYDHSQSETIAGETFHLDDSEDADNYTQLIYQNIVSSIESENIFVNDVQVAYYSNEYMEDVLYNNKESVFFGKTLSELDEQFAGKKYAFTIGDSGETEVHEFQNYDYTTENIIKNVAIGTSVIIVCVVVTIATYGAASEATVPCTVVVVNKLASDMAIGATVSALSGAAIGGVAAGLTTGYQTHDMNAAIKQAALAASESYKWGAIVGAASAGASDVIDLAWASGGGLSIKEAAFIQKQSKLSSSFIRQIKSYDAYKELTNLKNGLTIQEVEAIWKETHYSVDLIKNFLSVKEGKIYTDSGLFMENINGKLALVRNVDLNFKSLTNGKMLTNLERMQKGLSPIDPKSGLAYELHHVGQKINSPLAILTESEHRTGGNFGDLHDAKVANGQGVHNILPKAEWDAQRRDFWKALAAVLSLK